MDFIYTSKYKISLVFGGFVEIYWTAYYVKI
jgi:hypothetical protein